jgi:hypothetical protein
MKTTIPLYILLFMLSTGIFLSCEPDHLDTYSSSDGVYFEHPKNVDSLSIDLTLGAFAFRDDSLLRIPICVMGNISVEDRAVDYQLDAALSTAQLAADIELLPSQIDAGKETGYLQVRLKNSDALKTGGDTLLAVIHLLPNTYFHTNYSMQNIDEEKKDNLRFRIFFSSLLGGKPRLWRGVQVSALLNLGFGGNPTEDVFSEKFYRLLLEQCQIPEELFNYTDQEWEEATEPKDYSIFASHFGGHGIVSMWKSILIHYLSANPEVGKYQGGKFIIY